MAEGNGGAIVLPDEVWRELRGLIDPANHFYGTFTIAIADGKITHTERMSKVRTPVVSKD